MATQPPPAVLAELKRYGIRQKDLAEKFGCSEAIVSMWVHGVKPIPAYRLRDLWALAYLARQALHAGGAGRDALPAWMPTRVVWQTTTDHEAFTRTWYLPSSAHDAMHAWDQPTFQRILLQPGGGDSIDLHDATVDLRPYVDRVLAAALAGTPPDAEDLETLRHMTEMATTAIASLQETWAQHPLPPIQRPEEKPYADEIDQRRAVQRTDGK